MGIRTASTRSIERVDAGLGLVVVLLALAILGGLAAVVLVTQTATTTGQSHVLGLPPGLGDAPSNARRNINSTAAVACREDFQIVTRAVDFYEAEHETDPRSIAQLVGILNDSITSGRFVITLDPRHPGQVDVATAGHAAVKGAANCAYAG